MGNDFDCNKKVFRKEVKLVRNGEQAWDEMSKDVYGYILWGGVEVSMRWAEYFCR